MHYGGWAVVALAMTACGGKAQTAGPPPLDWTLQSLVWNENANPEDGVQLCVEGHPEIPCATTGDAGVPGVVNLALPSGKDLLVSYEKPGFYTKLREVSTRGEPCRGLCEFQIQHREWYYEVTGKVGGQGALDLDGRGIVAVEVHHGGDGVRFKLQRSDGQPVDFVGPAYFCVVNYKPYVALCPTGSTDGSLGLGAFLNVPEGDYRILIDASGSDKGSNIHCARPYGFGCGSDGSPDCVTAHVERGKLTFAGGIMCQ